MKACPEHINQAHIPKPHPSFVYYVCTYICTHTHAHTGSNCLYNLTEIDMCSFRLKVTQQKVTEFLIKFTFIKISNAYI